MELNFFLSGNGTSTPPLKSKLREDTFLFCCSILLKPFSETIWPIKLFRDSGGNATFTEKFGSY